MWHAPTEPGICDGSTFGKKEWKKIEVKRKKPTISAMLWLCMLRSFILRSCLPCTTWAREGKSVEAKVWLYRQESPATASALSQVPWRQTDIAVALFITSYNLQTTNLNFLQWVQKQAKNQKTQPLPFIPYIHTMSLERGKKPLLSHDTKFPILRHSSILWTTLVSSPHSICF